jgi:transposase
MPIYLLDILSGYIYVLPYMASLIAKKKANKLYYYLVESGRVDGKPRIVHQTYLGSAEKVADMVQDRAAPLPLSATFRDLGLPGALWLAAKKTGVFDLLQSNWPAPRSGPSTAHYLLLAAIHRICEPGPKTEVADWYEGTILRSLWHFPAERFTSQAFWDCFDEIRLSPPGSESIDRDDLDRAQLRLLALWKNKQMVSERLLSYDATNFYTFVASTNGRNTIAQRGHNKQGRHNLRQVGLSYILDGIYGLSLCHHVYPGNVPDTEEFSTAMPRLLRFLDDNQIPRDTVTLVFDKGSAALYNTLVLDQSGVGWISALPWNQAPPEFREKPLEQLKALSSDQPGVQAARAKLLVHGKARLCVLKYSAPFLSEQIHSLSTSLAKTTQSLRRFSVELTQPDCKLKEVHIRNKIARWLSSAQFLDELIRYELKHEGGRWRLQFDVDSSAFNRLMTQRLGRTVLMTSHMDWTEEQVIAGYSGQQQVEKVFRGLKDGDWLGWGPMYHWTDSKIRVHAFYCMLGISLLNYLHAQARRTCPQITVEQMKAELEEIYEFALLYPPQGEKGPYRTATVQSRQTLTQAMLSEALGLGELAHSRVGKTKSRR